ncbi:hypothetical protein FB107DRAFT_247081, partial [Schizophyllum commune]
MSPTTAGRGRGRPRKNQPADASSAPEGGAAADLVQRAGPWCDANRIQVNWTASRIQAVLDYFDERPTIRHQLFSDSIDDAKKEGRSRVSTAKTTKTSYYEAAAKAVLGTDSDDQYRAAVQLHPRKFATSVQQLINNRLKKKYRESNLKIGQTGAGKRREEITPGSDLDNIIQGIEREFPFWRQLHGWWRTLPNFNPYTTDSEQGQDHTTSAAQVTGYYGAPRLASQATNAALPEHALSHDPTSDDDAEGELDPDYTGVRDDSQSVTLGDGREDGLDEHPAPSTTPSARLED